MPPIPHYPFWVQLPHFLLDSESDVEFIVSSGAAVVSRVATGIRLQCYELLCPAMGTPFCLLFHSVYSVFTVCVSMLHVWHFVYQCTADSHYCGGHPDM